MADTPFLEWTEGASVCFPNEDEAEVLGETLADAYEVVVLKRGREGVRILRRGAPAVDVPPATAAAWGRPCANCVGLCPETEPDPTQFVARPRAGPPRARPPLACFPR